jgi:cell wall assembly regulator SMI1
MSDQSMIDARLRMDQRRSPSAADPAPVQTPATVSSRRAPSTTTADFTGASVPVQFKLPQDLAASLKLHSISNTESMSEIVLRCLTTSELVSKAWVSTRKAA